MVLPGKRRHVAAWGAAIAGFLAMLAVIVFALDPVGPRVLMDDAFIYARYARLWQETGSIVWNAGESPTYGATSLLYLALVTLAGFATGDEARALLLTAALAAGFWAASLVWMVRNERARGLMVLAFVPLLPFTNSILANLANGLDTGFAAGCLALWYGLYRWSVRESASKLVRMNFALLSGIFVWIRPELALITVPTAIWTLRRTGFALVPIGVLVATLSLNRMYFGEILPLPMFAKGFHGYEDFAPAGNWVRRLEQATPFFGAVMISGILLFCVGRRPERMRLSLPFWLSLGLATIIALKALPVMGDHGRFYFPLLSILVGEIARILAPTELRVTPWRLVPAALALPLLAVLFHGEPWRVLWRTSLDRAIYTERQTWYGIHSLAGHGPRLTVASTEVGMLGAKLRQHRIVDMAGLNDRNLARNHDEFPTRLFEARTDWIYLPFPAYRGLERRLRSHPTFRSDYVVIEADELKSLMGVAIRRDSPHFHTLVRVLPPRTQARLRVETRTAASNVTGTQAAL